MNCLRCGKSLDQDFGIVACTNCGAVMMIDLDGHPQLAEGGDAEPSDSDFELPTDLASTSESESGSNSGSESGSSSEASFGVESNSEFQENWSQDPKAASESGAFAGGQMSGAENLAEIADFGNQDVEAGSLQFQVRISEIDRGDLRQDVIEVLSDPRLALGGKELASKIKNGILILSGLNAARASLVVTRLQRLEVKIQWRQTLYEA